MPYYIEYIHIYFVNVGYCCRNTTVIFLVVLQGVNLFFKCLKQLFLEKGKFLTKD